MRSIVLLLAFAGLTIAANRTDKMEAAIHSGEFKKITSIAVAQHGKILYERYFDGDAQTLRNTRSATKTVTGMLVGIAIQKGLIPGVTAPVLPYFNDHQPFKNPDPLKAKITIEDLLTMNSSLDCNDWVDASPGNEERMYPTKDWVRFVFDLPVRPTRGFSYCTGGVAMLGEILQRSTKTPVPQFAQENLFDALGIRNEKWSFSPTGVAMTGGGLELATRDLIKLAELYLQKGRWNGKQLVPESWVEASIRAHLPIDDHTEYGYLWWLTNFKSEGKSYPAFFMTGNGGNKVVAIPGSDLVVVITSTNYNTRGMHQQTERLLIHPSRIRAIAIKVVYCCPAASYLPRTRAGSRYESGNRNRCRIRQCRSRDAGASRAVERREAYRIEYCSSSCELAYSVDNRTAVSNQTWWFSARTRRTWTNVSYGIKTI